MTRCFAVVCLALFATSHATTFADQRVTANVTVTANVLVQPGPVNRVLIKSGNSSAAVYAAPEGHEVEALLLTHHRRDVVWAAKSAIQSGAVIVGPLAERPLIENPAEFWADFKDARFHDYGQQTTKVVATPIKVSTWVSGGQTLRWNDIDFEVVDTPGYTRGSVSYITKIDGKRIAFVGDNIYGNGKLFDLYSFQDSIPTAKIGGYHGYGSRLAPLLDSLRKIAAAKPDILIPARGPVIHDPQVAIKKLIARVQAVYANYLSTNALNWYFKEERMTTAGRRVLGADADIKLMPYSVHMKTPDWVWESSTSRLLISDDGHGFLLDCGNQRVIDGVKKLIAMKLVTKVDGIFVTHFHDDHTNMVQQAAKEFGCPVYATKEYKDILEHPGAYHMPAMTSNAISDVIGLKHGHQMKWHEFQLTFEFFPGQTYYHGALLVERPNKAPIFFVGDAFSPSGIDDYCVLNRNLIHDDAGYFYCLKRVRELKAKTKGDYWLVNEHIPYVFRFSDRELDYLVGQYKKRRDVLAELFPWDDPNYGIDEQWAFFYPHALNAKASQSVKLEVRLENHSPIAREFEVSLRLPPGISATRTTEKVHIASRGTGVVRFSVTAPASAGQHIVVADVASGEIDVRGWVEAMIIVD